MRDEGSQTYQSNVNKKKEVTPTQWDTARVVDFREMMVKKMNNIKDYSNIRFLQNPTDHQSVQIDIQTVPSVERISKDTIEQAYGKLQQRSNFYFHTRSRSSIFGKKANSVLLHTKMYDITDTSHDSIESYYKKGIHSKPFSHFYQLQSKLRLQKESTGSLQILSKNQVSGPVQNSQRQAIKISNEKQQSLTGVTTSSDFGIIPILGTFL